MSVVMVSIAFAMSVVAVFMAYRAAFDTSKTRPLLVFSRNQETLWQVQNLGGGPALQVIIADSDVNGCWSCVAKCSPIGVNGSTPLPWIKNGFGLVAIYSDIDGHQFTTSYKEGDHSISKGNVFPELHPTHDEWFLLMAADAENNSPLKESDLIGKTAFELDLIRNEYYARYGYIFNRKDLHDYFSKQHWYCPTTDNQFHVYSRFSPTDRYNVELVLRYQRLHDLTTNKKHK